MTERLIRELTHVGRLDPTDAEAAEALADAMAGWDGAALAAYRAAVLDELAARGKGRVPPFLAVELAALSALEATPFPEPARRSA